MLAVSSSRSVPGNTVVWQIDNQHIAICNVSAWSSCRDAWNTLLEQIDNRDQKLLGAEEIHRFNRDVEDALTRIQVIHIRDLSTPPCYRD